MLLRELEESHGVSDSDAFAPSLAELKKAARSAATAPNCVYFSTNRSVASNASTSKSRAAGGRVSRLRGGPRSSTDVRRRSSPTGCACRKCLAGNRRRRRDTWRCCSLRSHGFCPAMRTCGRVSERSVASGDQPEVGSRLTLVSCRTASEACWRWCSTWLGACRKPTHRSTDPLTKAEAVVLIDEIDLHLHPKWQRQIVRNLTAAFPRCQFIATTHSPQVIGEVEHDRIQIIANGQVYSPTHSLRRRLQPSAGRDHGRGPASAGSQDAALADLAGDWEAAVRAAPVSLLAQLVERLGEDDPEVTRIRTLLDFMEGEE